jgi:hypothetical protein
MARCPVVYERHRCAPFKLGIEGAQCMLAVGHAGEHVAQIVKLFGDNPEDDVTELFRFKASPR